MELLSTLKQKNEEKDIQRPILLKIAPDLNDNQLDEIIEMIRSGKIVDSKTICSIFHYQLTSF